MAHQKTGEKEPICEDCFHRCNQLRQEAGLEPWVKMPDAYGIVDENEQAI